MTMRALSDTFEQSPLGVVSVGIGVGCSITTIVWILVEQRSAAGGHALSASASPVDLFAVAFDAWWQGRSDPRLFGTLMFQLTLANIGMAALIGWVCGVIACCKRSNARRYSIVGIVINIAVAAGISLFLFQDFPGGART